MGKKKKTKVKTRPTLAVVRVPNQQPMRAKDGPTADPVELAQLIAQALTENAALREAVQQKGEKG